MRSFPAIRPQRLRTGLAAAEIPALSRILIVAGNSTFRASLRTLFEAQHEFMVCGDARDVEEAIKKANKLQPGLIILDSAVASINGFETAKALSSALPSIPLFLLMDEYSFGSEKEALLSGVCAVFAKREDLTSLIANARAACGIQDSEAGNGTSDTRRRPSD